MPRPVDGRNAITPESLKYLSDRFVKKSVKIRHLMYFAPIQRIAGVEMTGIATHQFLTQSLEDLNHDRQILIMDNWNASMGLEYDRVLSIAKKTFKQKTAKMAQEIPMEEGDLLVKLQKAKAEA